ncbi:DNA-directed RNA polymerase subunit beta [Mycetocola tolaasinivorans]|uniref:DNA-directed RNA polymerase subunit beta n=1 Tax=Mycetocola tolaasinivorans TaxID=76635 RepID=A0A3L7ACJ1_9MICO|nr:DNA-directed RNA polymerase subunit beta [Mycetocola tolaasinivorans]RLP77371.1 DNA-directed RNA polymerase subunit beta [Mycetocola tolaasinivorans]
MFSIFAGGSDPAETSRISHETAHALLSRVRANPDADILDRLIAYTDEHGIETIAELWSSAPARSLPGALWRIYLLRVLIRQDPQSASLIFRRGSEVIPTIDPVIAGAAVPTNVEEITALADEILRGIFAGDFGIALDRAAAYCRINAAGCVSFANEEELIHPERAAELTRRGLRYSTLGAELTSCAKLWRAQSLD